MNKISYTIIIPHKNIPQLLQRCLASIPRRNDIQIIVVDDNSDADKVDFEHFPGLGEQCVEVYFTKEGKGAGYARNIGLKYEKGNWIIFADADDFFDEKAFDILDTHLSSQYDLIYFSSRSVMSDTLQEQNARISATNEAILEKDIQYLKYRNYVPWGKLYKRELITQNNIQFDETFASNDAMFSVKCGFYATKISLSSEIIYVSTIRENSLYYSISEKSSDARMVVSAKINDFIKKNNINFKYRWNRFPIILSYRKISFKKFFNTFLSSFNEDYFFLDVFEYIIFKCKLCSYPSLR